MSMNGITGYNAYAYSNPYALNNTYTNTNATTFQGYNTSAMYDAEETQEKDSGINPLLAIGGAIAAVGGTIYAIKKGKSINGADSSIFKNLKTGFSEIGTTLLNKVKGLFGRKTDITTADDIGKAAKEVIETSKAPFSNQAYENALENYKNTITEMGDKIWEEVTSPTYRTNYDYLLNK